MINPTPMLPPSPIEISGFFTSAFEAMKRRLGLFVLIVLFPSLLMLAVFLICLLLVGGLAASSWKDVTAIAPYTVIGLALSAVGAYYLNLLQLGDDMARSLGLSVEGARLGLTAVAALLAASAVSVAGLLGFVGLIVTASLIVPFLEYASDRALRETAWRA